VVEGTQGASKREQTKVSRRHGNWGNIRTPDLKSVLFFELEKPEDIGRTCSKNAGLD